MYVQGRRAEDVEPITNAVRGILEGRHRPAHGTLSRTHGDLDAAKNIALVLTAVLILISAIGAAHLRDRDHEHHAGDRDGADQGNRRPDGGPRFAE